MSPYHLDIFMDTFMKRQKDGNHNPIFVKTTDIET